MCSTNMDGNNYGKEDGFIWWCHSRESLCMRSISNKVWQKLQGNQSANSNLFKQYCSCSSISQSCPFSLNFEEGMNFSSINLNAGWPFWKLCLEHWHQLSFHTCGDKGMKLRLIRSRRNRGKAWCPATSVSIWREVCVPWGKCLVYDPHKGLVLGGHPRDGLWFDHALALWQNQTNGYK